jgi:hypothetical protein
MVRGNAKRIVTRTVLLLTITYKGIQDDRSA